MEFKKLRGIYRILFPIKLSEKDIFENSLLSNRLVKRIEKKENNNYVLTLHDGNEVYLRDEKHSDYDVFKQIFNIEEYKIIVSLLKYNPNLIQKETVLIDAGANVGYATVYFSNMNLFSRVFCIEPSSSNIDVLRRNINFLQNSKHITIYENALCERESANFQLSNTFRDGKDWSITTKEDIKGTISGITLKEIIKRNNLKHITVLKIDIEGAERFIFDKKNDLSFLKITGVIAIEIHDEYNIRDLITSLLKENNFFVFESDELIIGVNKNF